MVGHDSDGVLETRSYSRVVLCDRVMRDTSIACSVELEYNEK